MNIIEEFIERRFSGADKTYKDEWRNRFKSGIEYAKCCMDYESIHVFKQVLEDYILSL